MCKSIFLSLLFLLTAYCAAATATPLEAPEEENMDTFAVSNGELITLALGREYLVKEDFSLKLVSFSHKRPMLGGPTKATAYIVVVRGDKSEQIELSQHGTEGKQTDALLEQGYDQIEWQQYLFTLKSMDYDRSVELLIHKREAD